MPHTKECWSSSLALYSLTLRIVCHEIQDAVLLPCCCRRSWYKRRSQILACQILLAWRSCQLGVRQPIQEAYDISCFSTLLVCWYAPIHKLLTLRVFHSKITFFLPNFSQNPTLFPPIFWTKPTLFLPNFRAKSPEIQQGQFKYPPESWKICKKSVSLRPNTYM